MSSHKKRICFVLPDLAVGGIARVKIALTNYLHLQGYEIDIVVPHLASPNLLEYNRHARIFDLGASRSVTALPGLVKYFRERKPDVVISSCSHISVLTFLAARISGAKPRLIFSEHFNFSAAVREASIFKTAVLRMLMAKFYPRAHAVLAVSRGIADDLEELLPNIKGKISVIYNPYSLPDDAIERGDKASRDPIWERSFIAVGRLAPQKDYPSLIQAFKIVRQATNANLHIIGGGELYPVLRAMAEDTGVGNDIHFHGPIKSPAQMISNADVFVLSSLYEGFANVLVEAITCGTRVVSTRCPSGPDELLEGGKWGRLVPVGDVEALAEAMLQALDDPSPPDVRVRSHDFTMEKIGPDYVNLIEST